MDRQTLADAIFKASLIPSNSYIVTRQQLLDILEVLDALAEYENPPEVPKSFDCEETELAFMDHKFGQITSLKGYF